MAAIADNRASVSSTFRYLACACAAATASLATMQAATAQTERAAAFYQGKTIRLLLPTGPGGGRALYALPFAEAFSRHIPGNPRVVPLFMPGAGGSTAINNAQNVAEPDGLTIVSPLKGSVIAQATEDPSVKYDLRRFNWIGRITDATQIFFISGKVPARTIDDMRTQEIIVGAGGRASVTYQLPAFINRVVGTRLKIVTGYPSAGATNMSVHKGETHGAFTTWNDLSSYHMDSIRDGKVRVVVQIALHQLPELKSVPLLSDYATNEGDRELIDFMSSSSDLGQVYAAPPGVPDYLVEALRIGFNATMKDTSYTDKLLKSKIQFNPMTGQEIAQDVLKTLNAPRSLIDRYQAAVN
jgi:tripartite-type tricarboxylate transporter receptor subunit TctC